jgi:hypothetical protein
VSQCSQIQCSSKQGKGEICTECSRAATVTRQHTTTVGSSARRPLDLAAESRAPKRAGMPAAPKKPFTVTFRGFGGKPGGKPAVAKPIAKGARPIAAAASTSAAQVVAPAPRLASRQQQQQPPSQQQQKQKQQRAPKHQPQPQPQPQPDLARSAATASLLLACDERQLPCTCTLLEHATELRRSAMELNVILATTTVHSTAAISATSSSRFLVQLNAQNREPSAELA